MAPKHIKTETTAEAHMITVIAPQIESIKSDIEQTRLDQKTTVETIKMCTQEIQDSFEEMRCQRAQGRRLELLQKSDVAEVVQAETKAGITNALKGFDMHARIPESDLKRLDQSIDMLKEVIKRPPLMEFRLNPNGEFLLVVICSLITFATVTLLWFINTPMYLSNQLYQSCCQLNHPSPGREYHWAYKTVEAGNIAKVKKQINLNKASIKECKAYADTLCQILPAQKIYICNIQHNKAEKLIDFTDSTGVIRTAHFRGNGTIRITDDPRMITLEDARKRKDIKWKTISPPK